MEVTPTGFTSKCWVFFYMTYINELNDSYLNKLLVVFL